MKKRNLKNLSLNKRSISNFNAEQLHANLMGGLSGSRCDCSNDCPSGPPDEPYEPYTSRSFTNGFPTECESSN
ncbi:class I lanthipeptide [Kordia sp.]|uniref:class I lanthipeptide n=1 Tax=Kordia sp. TaxID=1965332 RepID=UPI003D2D9288